MDIQITPDDVQTMVKDAILKAGIGKLISEKVNETLRSNYSNPIDHAVKAFVSELAVSLIRDKYAASITEMVRVEIEARITKEMLQKFIETAVQKLERAARDGY